jgi:chemotaxis family two-component system sensor kinase Cph1
MEKNFDSDFCGSLPINFVNSIQDYGYLVVVDRRSFSIIQLSENLPLLLSANPEDLLNKDIRDLFIGMHSESLQNYLAQENTQLAPLVLQLSFDSNKIDFLTALHIYPDYFIMELEKYSKEYEHSFIDVYSDVKHLLSRVDNSKTVQECCENTIKAIKDFSGYDSVLLYKFDESWNGTVLAEINSEDIPRYLGLKFPASDIPRKAREMYLKNIYRLIPNRSYQAVKLFPVINSITNTFTDLSECNLRAVPAVHLEYMSNMNLEASLSIRIIKDGELWGLISCHHSTEKQLSYEQCAVFELISTLISNKISSIINHEDYQFERNLQSIRNELIEKMYHQNNFISAFLNKQETNILNLFNASGAVVILNGQIETIGEVISTDQIENLVLWSQAKKIGHVFASDEFSDLYEDADIYKNLASGIIIIPVDFENGDFIFVLRPEIIRTIKWAGNPNEAINFEEDGKKYHPRNSFEVWKEVVKNTADKWHPTEIEMASHLKSVLYEFKMRHL